MPLSIMMMSGEGHCGREGKPGQDNFEFAPVVFVDDARCVQDLDAFLVGQARAGADEANVTGRKFDGDASANGAAGAACRRATVVRRRTGRSRPRPKLLGSEAWRCW